MGTGSIQRRGRYRQAEPVPEPSPDFDAAVAHRGGAALVLGVAGSGRTELLARRFVALVDDGVAGERIAVLTQGRPTPDAGCEAGSRRSSIAPTRSCWVHTWEELAEKLLRDYALEAGLDPFFEVVGPADRLAVMLDRLDELPLRRHEIRGNPAGLLARLLERIDVLKAEGIGPPSCATAPAPPSAEPAAAPLGRRRCASSSSPTSSSAMTRSCSSRGAIDEPELILELGRLLSRRPDVSPGDRRPLPGADGRRARGRRPRPRGAAAAARPPRAGARHLRPGPGPGRLPRLGRGRCGPLPRPPIRPPASTRSSRRCVASKVRAPRCRPPPLAPPRRSPPRPTSWAPRKAGGRSAPARPTPTQARRRLPILRRRKGPARACASGAAATSAPRPRPSPARSSSCWRAGACQPEDVCVVAGPAGREGTAGGGGARGAQRALPQQRLGGVLPAPGGTRRDRMATRAGRSRRLGGRRPGADPAAGRAALGRSRSLHDDRPASQARHDLRGRGGAREPAAATALTRPDPRLPEALPGRRQGARPTQRRRLRSTPDRAGWLPSARPLRAPAPRRRSGLSTSAGSPISPASWTRRRPDGSSREFIRYLSAVAEAGQRFSRAIDSPPAGAVLLAEPGQLKGMEFERVYCSGSRAAPTVAAASGPAGSIPSCSPSRARRRAAAARGGAAGPPCLRRALPRPRLGRPLLSGGDPGRSRAALADLRGGAGARRRRGDARGGAVRAC